MRYINTGYGYQTILHPSETVTVLTKADEFYKNYNSHWMATSLNLKGDENMENLYEVWVVTKYKKILINGLVVVAKNEEDAKFDLRVSEVIRKEDLRLDDVTIIVRNLGSVKVYKKVWGNDKE